MGDGTFIRVTPGSPATEPGPSLGGWLVDVNNDGFLDLLSLTPPAPGSSPVRYYRNNGNANHWLAVKCVGTSSPRFVSGTKVRLKATLSSNSNPTRQLRIVDPGGCANGQNFTAHFGLGDATNVEVLRIEWTSGIVQELAHVAVDQYLTVTEPAKPSMPRPGNLEIPCWKGIAFGIEASTSLTTWTGLTSLTNLNLTAGIQWIDPGASTHSLRFYRAVPAQFARPESWGSAQWLEDVLRQLGCQDVKLYDGSWLEWSSKGGTVERGQ